MPIKPNPIKFSCLSCGWKKTVSPASDALIMGFDYFEQCPRCGEVSLKTQSVSTLEEKIYNIIRIINPK